MDGPGEAADQADVMRVVDVQVDRRAPAPVGVGDPARPVGLGDHPHQVRGPELPVAARPHGLGRVGELGEEREHVPDHQQLPARPRGGHHRVGLGGRQRDRLLDQHMLARLERADGESGVLVVGDAEVDEVDLGIGQQVGDVGMPGVSREVHLRPARAEVALDAGPVPRQLLGVPTAERRHAPSGQPAGGQVVDHPHEADADDADAHHLGSPLVEEEVTGREGWEATRGVSAGVVRRRVG